MDWFRIINSELTLTVMPCTGVSESINPHVVPMTYSSGIFESIGLVFQLSRWNKKSGLSRSLRLWGTTDKMIERGKRIEFFYQHSMAYMIVYVRNHDLSIQKRHVMCDDSQGSSIINTFNF